MALERKVFLLFHDECVYFPWKVNKVNTFMDSPEQTND